MNRPKQFQEGYLDYGYGIFIDANPYDRAAQPEQYKAWRIGWKQAKFDKEDIDKHIIDNPEDSK